MDRPWWKFCGRDWRNDQELYLCSIGARGLWIAMLTLMNEGVPYGHLSTIAGPVTPKRLAESEHISTSQCQKLLTELEEHSVFSRNESGFIFSRRMVRDEEIRLKRAAGGSLGGNPNLAPKVNHNGWCDGLHEKHPTRAHRALVSSLSPSVEVKKSEDVILESYQDLVEAWPGDRREVDLGAQIWISLAECGEITAANVAEVFAGLERWKASEQWRKDNCKYVPSMAKWLQKRAWKDYPKAAEVGGW